MSNKGCQRSAVSFRKKGCQLSALSCQLLGFALVLLLLPSVAFAQKAAWLRDRVDVEWVVATGGWRTAVGMDIRAPGFDALAGGGEAVLGFDVGAGLAVVGDGRVLAGQAAGNHIYFEGLGGVALQLRLGRVRVRAGPAAGEVRFRGDNATLIGGFLGASIDLFPLGAGRLSTALSLRLDLDEDVGTLTYLPDASVAFGIGLGVRY